eukprot:scaffold7036_cov326-Pinguiococcus_pyrenoidosus.AAC.1
MTQPRLGISTQDDLTVQWARSDLHALQAVVRQQQKHLLQGVPEKNSLLKVLEQAHRCPVVSKPFGDVQTGVIQRVDPESTLRSIPSDLEAEVQTCKLDQGDLALIAGLARSAAGPTENVCKVVQPGSKGGDAGKSAPGWGLCQIQQRQRAGD